MNLDPNQAEFKVEENPSSRDEYSENLQAIFERVLYVAPEAQKEFYQHLKEKLPLLKQEQPDPKASELIGQPDQPMGPQMMMMAEPKDIFMQPRFGPLFKRCIETYPEILAPLRISIDDALNARARIESRSPEARDAAINMIFFAENPIGQSFLLAKSKVVSYKYAEYEDQFLSLAFQHFLRKQPDVRKECATLISKFVDHKSDIALDFKIYAKDLRSKVYDVNILSSFIKATLIGVSYHQTQNRINPSQSLLYCDAIFKITEQLSITFAILQDERDIFLLPMSAGAEIKEEIKDDDMENSQAVQDKESLSLLNELESIKTQTKEAFLLKKMQEQNLRHKLTEEANKMQKEWEAMVKARIAAKKRTRQDADLQDSTIEKSKAILREGRQSPPFEEKITPSDFPEQI